MMRLSPEKAAAFVRRWVDDRRRLSQVGETPCVPRSYERGYWLAVFVMIMMQCATVAHALKPLTIAPVSHAAPVDYDKEIHPILKANCISCHNKTTTKGDLNIETRALMLKGGENGPAISPGKGAESLLLKSAAHLDDPPMPPKGNKVNAVDLKPEELGLLKLWIDQGAKMPDRREKLIVWEPLPEGLKGIYAVALT